MASIPLYKNEAAGCYEAIYKGHHIVVPFEVFSEHLHQHTKYRVDRRGEEIGAAGNAAFFELLDAKQWNTPDWWHTDTPQAETRVGTCTLSPETVTCDCPADICMLRNAKEQQQAKESFSVYLDDRSDAAALERMADYFYYLYHRAGQGTEQETRYAAIYTEAKGALARREIATHLETVTAQIDTLMAAITLTMGAVVDRLNTSSTEKEEKDTDARTDTTPPAPEL